VYITAIEIEKHAVRELYLYGTQQPPHGFKRVKGWSLGFGRPYLYGSGAQYGVTATVLERNVARAMASHWAWSDRAFYSENWDRRKRELKPKLVRWNPSWINEPEDKYYKSAGHLC
jgi:hypothetical protein